MFLKDWKAAGCCNSLLATHVAENTKILNYIMETLLGRHYDMQLFTLKFYFLDGLREVFECLDTKKIEWIVGKNGQCEHYAGFYRMSQSWLSEVIETGLFKLLIRRGGATIPEKKNTKESFCNDRQMTPFLIQLAKIMLIMFMKGMRSVLGGKMGLCCRKYDMYWMGFPVLLFNKLNETTIWKMNRYTKCLEETCRTVENDSENYTTNSCPLDSEQCEVYG